MININIFGICVLRDIFNYNKDNNFIVKKFVQDISPYSAASEGYVIKDENQLNNSIENYNVTNFIKRNIKLDLGKKAFEFIAEEKTNYIFIDCACCRYNLYFFPENNCYTTKTLHNYNAIKCTDYLKYYEEINTETIDDHILFSLLDKFIEKILQLYQPQQVILFEIKAIPYLLAKQGQRIILSRNEWAIEYNRRIDKAYEYVKNNLQGCHIVEFPNGILADENHIWGNSVFHYIKEYYEYAYNAIKIISNQLPIDTEIQALKDLKKYYEEIIFDKYQNIKLKTLIYQEETESSVQRLRKYIEYLRDLLLDNTKLNKLIKYFKLNNIKRCAFYGATYIGKFLIDYLIKNLPELTIDYIVENSSSESYKGINFIKRNSSCFPETQLIIISEVLHTKAIYDKLSKMRISALITDVYKILE